MSDHLWLAEFGERRRLFTAQVRRQRVGGSVAPDEAGEKDPPLARER